MGHRTELIFKQSGKSAWLKNAVNRKKIGIGIYHSNGVKTSMYLYINDTHKGYLNKYGRVALLERLLPTVKSLNHRKHYVYNILMEPELIKDSKTKMNYPCEVIITEMTISN